MKALLKAIAIALPLVAGVPVPETPAAPQDLAMPSAEQKAVAERKRMLAEIITRAAPASRLPEIYADLRYDLAEFYLPALRDIVSDPGAANSDANTLAKLSALAPVLDYGLRAARELDPVLAASRGELIEDIAAHQAKYSSEEEIRLFAEFLDAPAMRKAFNAVYALSRCVTGYDQADMRSSKEISAWLKDFKLDAKANPFAPSDLPPPPPGKVAKAGAIVTDFLRVSRLDDMIGEIVGFTRNVVLQVDALKPEEADAVRGGLQQFEFYYNLGKSMALAVAPSSIAAALSDDQLNKLHLMVLSPVMAKSFGLIYGAVRESTAFTKQDIADFRHLAEKGERIGERWKRNPELQAKINAEWESLADKWRKRFEDSLSPETRHGLETSLAVYQSLVAAQEAKVKAVDEGNKDGEDDEDEDDDDDKGAKNAMPVEHRRL